jgi:hypothetical protein
MEGDALLRLKGFVVISQPVGERLHFSVAPHPGREPSERLAAGGKGFAMARISINARRVGPVRLDGDEGKAVMADEPLRDGGARTIEFRGPVSGFSDEHNARIGEAVEEQAELIRSLRRGKRLAMMTENPGDLTLDGLATSLKHG